MNENLKQQEQEFRTHCRVSVGAAVRTGPHAAARLMVDLCVCVCVCTQEEMVRLQQNIEELKSASGQDLEEEKVPPGSDPFCCHEQLTEPSDPLLCVVVQRGTRLTRSTTRTGRSCRRSVCSW